jgi:hypothetical protein
VLRRARCHQDRPELRTCQAEIAHRYSPSNWGEFTLRARCPPGGESAPQELVSPLLLGVRQQAEAPQMPTKWRIPPPSRSFLARGSD